MTIMLIVTLRPGLFWQQIAYLPHKCVQLWVRDDEAGVQGLVCQLCPWGRPASPGPSPDYLVKVLQLLKINLSVKRIQSFL